MACTGGDWGAGCNVPEANGLVATTGTEDGAIRTELNMKNGFCVSRNIVAATGDGVHAEEGQGDVTDGDASFGCETLEESTTNDQDILPL